MAQNIVVPPLTQINGFCSKECRDLFMASLLISPNVGLHSSIPEMSDQAVFKTPPLLLPDLFNVNLLQKETCRAFIFKHSNIPAELTKRMESFHKWHPEDYFLVRINDRNIVFRQLALKYIRDHEHSNAAECICNHAENLAMCRGWMLYEYKLGTSIFFCLTFKPEKSSVRHCPKRAKTSRLVYEGKEDYQGNPREGLKKLISGGESAPPLIGCGVPGGQGVESSLEFLKNFRRVLYIGIDVDHGDGVEEAFSTTDGVMAVSFRKFGDFLSGPGRCALNVPLNDDLDDESFHNLFRSLIQKVMEVYQPEAVVLQSGADSLSGDRLGCFNLSVKGHADCIHFLRSYNIPLMTAVAVGAEPYYEYFGQDHTLHVEPSAMENLNTPKDMENIRKTLLEQLLELIHAPSVPFQHTRVFDESEDVSAAVYESDSEDDSFLDIGGQSMDRDSTYEDEMEEALHGLSEIGSLTMDRDSTYEDEMEEALVCFSEIGGLTMDRDSTGEDEMEDDYRA